MFRLKNLFLFLLLLGVTSLFGQEICDNAIDDDGDGLIDLNDVEDCRCFVEIGQFTGDFENMSCCPDTYNQFFCEADWENATMATPDYFNTCDYVGDLAIPFVPMPMPSGNGCVGFATNFNVSEYVGVCLPTPMVAGEVYDIEFYVGFHENMNTFSTSPWNISLYGTTSCNAMPANTVLCLGDLTNWETVATFTVSGSDNTWVHVTGTFTAGSNYTTIAMGPACEELLTLIDYHFFDGLIIEGPFGVTPPKPEIDEVGDCLTGITLSTSYPGNIGFQWYLDGIAIVGATAFTYDLPPGAEGVYQVRAYLPDGCTTSIQHEVTIDPNVIEFDGDLVHVVCANDGNGSIELTNINSPNTPLDIMWSNGENTQLIENLDGGLYAVQVTDARGCVGSGVFVIEEPPQLFGQVVNIVQPNFPDTLGKAQAIAWGGVPPYEFLWDTGEDGDAVTDLEPGLHHLTITDETDCEYVFEILINPVFKPELDAFRGICGDSCSGTISLDIVGGKPPYKWKWSTGNDSTLFLKNLCPGNYSVEVTDSVGLKQNLSAVIIPEPDIELKGDVVAKICESGDRGSIDLSVLVGTPPFSFQWSNGSSSEDIADLEAGWYTVTVEDSRPCVTVDSFELVAGIPVRFDGEVERTTCGFDNGRIEAVLTQGEAPFTYSWSDGSTASFIENKPPGTYSVAVTGSDGCAYVDSFSIDPSFPITIDSSIAHNHCEETANGSIELTVVTGVQPIEYTWASGQKTSFINNLGPATYSVTMEDADGCLHVSEYDISTLSSLAIDSLIADETCFGMEDGQIRVDVTSGLAPHRFLWNIGSTSPEIDELAAGSYDLLITDSLGCEYAYRFMIAPGNVTSVQEDIEYNLCFGEANGSIASTVQGKGPFQYHWNGVPGDDTLENLPNGTYDLVVIDADGCETEAGYEITSPDALALQSFLTQPGCNEGDTTGTIRLFPSGGLPPFLYDWGFTQTNVDSIYGLSPDTYTLEMSDANGCLFRDTFDIIQGIPFVVGSEVDSIECFGQNAQIEIVHQNGTGQIDYQWNDGGNERVRDDIKAGAYAVTVTDEIGCVKYLSFNIGQPDSVQTNLSILNIPTPVNGDGSAQVDVVGGIPPYDIRWSSGGSGPNANNLSFGTHTVTVTDANGCTDVVTFEMIPTPLSVDLMAVHNLCYSDCTGAISLSIDGGLLPYAAIWSNGQSGMTANDLCAGMYAVTISDAYGQSVVFDQLEITQPPALIVNVSSTQPTCFDKENGAIQLTAGGGSPAYTYLWNGQIFGADRIDLGEGVYAVEVVDNNGCRWKDEVILESPGKIALEAEGRNIDCHNLTGRIIVSGENTYDYDIYLNGSKMVGTTPIVVDDLPSGVFVISYRIAPDCEEVVGQIEIVDENDFVITGLPSSLRPDQGEPVDVEMVVEGNADLIDIINWSANDGELDCFSFIDADVCVGMTARFFSADTLLVEVLQDNGCIRAFRIPVNVRISDDLFIPNIFSPNGDGDNDVFKMADSRNLSHIETFVVFDRWGNKVFAESAKPVREIIGWDGTVDGRPAADGVYIYMVSAVLVDGRKVISAGDVTVVH